MRAVTWTKLGNCQESLSQQREKKIWTLQDANDNFTAIFDAAASGEPQYIARRDTPVAVVVSSEDYDLMNRVLKRNAPSFVDMLLAMPQSDSDEELFERITWDTPPFDFGDPEDFDVPS